MWDRVQGLQFRCFGGEDLGFELGNFGLGGLRVWDLEQADTDPTAQCS